MEERNIFFLTSEYSRIGVETEKSTYIQGERIEGRVNLCLEKEFPGGEINLSLKGREKTRFTIAKDMSYNHYSDSYIFCELNSPINKGEQIKEGEYYFPFDFSLDENYPPTFTHGGYDFNFGSVEYILTAQLISTEGGVHNLEGKLELLIRSKYTQLSADNDSPFAYKLSKEMKVLCGTCSRGTANTTHAYFISWG